ncbi:MAG TPA: hypothetical protein VMW69_12100 [Spirochaetia bacterium]|nr:hypothetical protein [Spirochaetia bacterium]
MPLPSSDLNVSSRSRVVCEFISGNEAHVKLVILYHGELAASERPDLLDDVVEQRIVGSLEMEWFFPNNH